MSGTNLQSTNPPVITPLQFKSWNDAWWLTPSFDNAASLSLKRSNASHINGPSDTLIQSDPTLF